MTSAHANTFGDALQQPLSPVAARLLARARGELQSGQADAADRTLSAALALAPDNIEIIHELGAATYARGDFARSADCFRRVLAAKPDDSDARVWFGITLFQSGHANEAIAQLRQACGIAPDSVAAWYNLAEVLRSRAYPDDALAALQRVLALDPSHIPAMLAMARTHASVGHVDEAVAGLHEVLRRQPENAEIWFELANLKVRFDRDELACFDRTFSDPQASPQSRIWSGFALARALEDNNEYGRAFEVLREANALQRRSVNWDAAGEHARVQAIFRTWNSGIPVPRDPDLGSKVIFIACIPRSGSTLVEQILASHPQVEGANEIRDVRHVIDAETIRRGSAFPLWVPDANQDDWLRMGNEYLARTVRWRERKPYFTDKNLGNWMLLGTGLTMLPAARAIVCRRDPLETCLACYRQWFSQGAGFSYDLDEMADYCIDFVRLTRFWLERFPGRVFDLEYETLVAEPEATIRRLLDFCGLPFDTACLEFHRTERAVLSAPSAAQVRQPLHNTARATRYGDKLDGLRKRLRDAGLLQ